MIVVFPDHTHLLFLYVLHVLSKQLARKQNCLKMSIIKTSPLKSNTKLKMNKIVKMGQTTENEIKSSKKEKRKKIVKTKDKDKKDKKGQNTIKNYGVDI